MGWLRPAGRGRACGGRSEEVRGFRVLSDIYIGGQARRFRRLRLAKSAAIRPRTLQVVETEFANSGVKVLDKRIGVTP